MRFISDAKPIAGNILLMFYSVARDGVFSTATEDLVIGCVRTMAVSQKKVSIAANCFLSSSTLYREW